MPMQAQKLKKIATPPRRGRGLECKWRSCVGTATKPWEIAKSRTYFVRTNADSRPVKNRPRQIRVNYATSTQATTETALGLQVWQRDLATKSECNDSG